MKVSKKMSLKNKSYSHKPVLLDRFLELCSPIDGIWVDCTFGGGGFTEGLLSRGAEQVICIDRDPEVINGAFSFKKNLEKKFN